MRVQLPSDLREQLKVDLGRLTRAADAAYRTKSKAKSTVAEPPKERVEGPLGPLPKPPKPPVTDEFPAAPTTETSEIPWPPAPFVGPGVRRSALESAAEVAGEAESLARIVEKLKTDSPEVAHDLGW